MVLQMNSLLHAAARVVDVTTQLHIDCVGSTEIQGGFCTVVQAQHNQFGRVAIKRPRAIVEKLKAKEELLAEECVLLARLDHPHIIACIGYCHVMDTLGIVTPWAENGTLGSYLRVQPDANRVRLLSEIASALAYLHTRNPPVGHCDLHVDNVLVSSEGHALLNDFGLSREIIPGVRTRDGQGPPVYQAPEVLQNGIYSPASDVFAFGMLIVETYSGQKPLVRARTPSAVIVQLSDNERPSREEITRMDFVESLWKLAVECWAQDPVLRPTMTNVHARLAAL